MNYNIASKTVTEWNVGRARCHNPGREHVAGPSRANIVNPSRLDPIAATDVCVHCHSEGRPPGSIDGEDYHWPVGFSVGRHLPDFWTLEPHPLGETAGGISPTGRRARTGCRATTSCRA